MLLDGFLPAWDFAERHALRVAAPPEATYAVARTLDLSGSLPVRTLIALRGLPARLAAGARGRGLGLDLDALLRGGFVLLGERPPHEFVLGLAGRFWRPSGGLLRFSAEEFRALDQPGIAVAAWNFTVLPAEDGSLLATETRIRCTDARARRSFGAYWRVIRPFSGLIRREALRTIRRTAEQGVRTGLAPAEAP